MFGNVPLHAKQGSLEAIEFPGIEIGQCVEHAVVEGRSCPERLNQIRVHVPGRLFVDPDQVANCAGLGPSIGQRFENVELAGARIAVLADIRIEFEQLDPGKVNALLAEEMQRKNARLRRVAAPDRQRPAFQVFEVADPGIGADDDSRVEVLIRVTHGERQGPVLALLLHAHVRQRRVPGDVDVPLDQELDLAFVV